MRLAGVAFAAAVGAAITAACSSFRATPAATETPDASTPIERPDGAPIASDGGAPAPVKDAAAPDDPAFEDAGDGCTDVIDESLGAFDGGTWIPAGNVGDPFTPTATPFDASAPEDPALRFTATSGPTNGAFRYLLKTFPLATFEVVKARYEIGFANIDGYAEFGCKVGWTNKPGDDSAASELRRNDPAGDSVYQVYGTVTSAESAVGFLDADGVNAALTIPNVFHTVATSMTFVDQAHLAYTFVVDGHAAQPVTFAPPKKFDTLEVGCGVIYVAPGAKRMDLAIRKVKVSLCP